MTVGGSETLDAEPAAVRAVLAEPERLAEVLPGVGDFSWLSREQGTFEATLRPAIALGEIPIATVWQQVRSEDGTVAYAMEGRTDEHRLELAISLRLRAEGAGSTVADWQVQCRFTGTMLAVGQRVLPAVVARQAHLVLRAVERAAAVGR